MKRLASIGGRPRLPTARCVDASPSKRNLDSNLCCKYCKNPNPNPKWDGSSFKESNRIPFYVGTIYREA